MFQHIFSQMAFTRTTECQSHSLRSIRPSSNCVQWKMNKKMRWMENRKRIQHTKSTDSMTTATNIALNPNWNRNVWGWGVVLFTLLFMRVNGIGKKVERRAVAQKTTTAFKIEKHDNLHYSNKTFIVFGMLWRCCVCWRERSRNIERACTCTTQKREIHPKTKKRKANKAGQANGKDSFLLCSSACYAPDDNKNCNNIQ